MRKLMIQSAAALLAASILLAAVFGLLLPLRERNDIADFPAAEDGSQEQPEQLPDDSPVLPDIPETPEDSDGPEEETEPDVPAQEEIQPELPAPESTAKYVRAKVNGLQLRSGPGTGYASLGNINKGDMVTLLGKEGNWYRTVYKNKTAYISAGNSYTEEYEMSYSGDERIERIVEEGLRLLGFPYVYGAIRLHDGKGNLLKNFDPGEYDCSSLMQYMFYHGAGVNLNMTTRTQVSQGKHVARSEIARGDLVFFTNSTRYNKTGVERIGHVALYLGDNYILHTASDYAVIEEISTQRWKYYIETRRMV